MLQMSFDLRSDLTGLPPESPLNSKIFKLQNLQDSDDQVPTDDLNMLDLLTSHYKATQSDRAINLQMTTQD